MPLHYTLYGSLLVMAVVAIAFILPPLFKTPVASATRAEDAQRDFMRGLDTIFSQERQALEASLAAHEITPTQFEAFLDDLKARAVREHQEAVSSQPHQHEVWALRQRLTLWLAVAVTIVVASFSIYSKVGSPDTLALDQLLATNQGQVTVPLLERHLIDNPTDARAWVLLAQKAADQEDFAKATHAYRQARELSTKIKGDPDIDLAYGAAALTIQSQKDYPQVKEALLQAQIARPEDPRASKLLLHLAFETHDWQLAQSQIQLAMQHFSPDSASYVQLEELLHRVQSFQAAPGH